jgi:hypothetical protein
MSQRLSDLISATDAVLKKLEAPLTDDDRRCHWREDAQAGWTQYIRDLRDSLQTLHREGKEWTAEAATRNRVWHIAHGLDSDGLHSGDRADSLIGLQRTLVGDFRD